MGLSGFDLIASMDKGEVCLSVNGNNSNWYNAGASTQKMNTMYAAAQVAAAIPGSLHRPTTMVFFEKMLKKFGNLKYFCYICITKVFKTTIKNISKKLK